VPGGPRPGCGGGGEFDIASSRGGALGLEGADARRSRLDGELERARGGHPSHAAAPTEEARRRIPRRGVPRESPNQHAADMGRYGEMWGDMGRYGEIWGDSGRTSRGRGRSPGRSRAPMGHGIFPRENGPTAAPLARSYPGNISWATRRVSGTGDEVRGPARLSRSLDFRLRCATTTRHRLARALLLRVVAKHVRHRQPPVPGGRAAAEGLSAEMRRDRAEMRRRQPHPTLHDASLGLWRQTRSGRW
jgi:hypothetical protein